MLLLFVLEKVFGDLLDIVSEIEKIRDVDEGHQSEGDIRKLPEDFGSTDCT